ncbi:MAG TPA: galactokinase family protein [Anaerolineae bacterium]|nr:galactokinase family protein [Anaerolineae bacterium]HQK12360.1 galactokinase family protein [Anaerolineae bacterium]
MQIEVLKQHLKQRTGCADRDIWIVYAPLRISPLGAHVDHQDGLVTGMTLNRAILLAFTPRADRRVCVESLNFPGRVEFALDDVPLKSAKDWGNYVRGAALALQQHYTLHTGIDAVVGGDMPIGGLSSSAAVGVAYLLALETVNGLMLSAGENIQLDRYIENIYLGLKNGIMDQSMILMSEHDTLTYLDCQAVAFEKIPIPPDKNGFDILVVYSGVEQALVGTDYNNRVAECQEAARLLLTWAGEQPPEHPRLRMVPEAVYAELGERLPAPLNRRARHFFTEVARVREGVVAWRAGDVTRIGQLMRESGASSIHNYESGCPQLVTLYNILCAAPGVYGARFSGAGFRGSCIGLSDPAYREEIRAFIDARYPAAHPNAAAHYSVHFCKSDGPARVLNGGL